MRQKYSIDFSLSSPIGWGDYVSLIPNDWQLACLWKSFIANHFLVDAGKENKQQTKTWKKILPEVWPLYDLELWDKLQRETFCRFHLCNTWRIQNLTNHIQNSCNSSNQWARISERHLFQMNEIKEYWSSSKERSRERSSVDANYCFILTLFYES